MGSYFKIINKEDGVYIEIISSTETDKNVDINEIVEKLHEQNVIFDIQVLMNAMEDVTNNPLFKISDTLKTSKEEISEEKNFSIFVSNDQMRVKIKFYRTNTQNQFQLNIDEILAEAKRIKIAVPINEELLLEIEKNVDFNTDYVIAKGIEVVETKEAKIEYLFKTEKDLRPEVDKDGNVNYHRLNIIAHVTKDQLLAKLLPGENGVSGKDVFGNEIKPKKARFIKLKRGKNVRINEEQTELYAEIDGLVKLENEKITVNDTLEINGNVGSSTGDIDFKGSIVVNGNVMTGFTIVASGDIEVVGVVEGAMVHSGGNITLHRGIQGMNSSCIKAAGNVSARYIENGEVYAGGCVHSEAILHSRVSAKGQIIVEGKKGMITGGVVRSGIEVSANILGSHMGTQTIVEVGIDPLMWDEYNKLNKEYPKMLEDLEKLDQVIALLNKRKEIEKELDQQKQDMYISAIRNKIVLNNKAILAEKRLEELQLEVEQRNNGKIKAKNIIYPGVRIAIGTAKYFVRDEIKYVCMEKEGADVKLTSL